jgi:hypothetical protein
MRGEDRILTARIKQSRGLLREVIDLADLQGWTFRPKENGLLFFPPKTIVRPGFESIYAYDPGNDSSKQKHLRDRFRKGGMKFPEDCELERVPKVNQKPVIAASNGGTKLPPADPVAAIRQKINQALDSLAEIDPLLQQIETDNGKLKKLAEALSLFK